MENASLSIPLLYLPTYQNLLWITPFLLQIRLHKLMPIPKFLKLFYQKNLNCGWIKLSTLSMYTPKELSNTGESYTLGHTIATINWWLLISGLHLILFHSQLINVIDIHFNFFVFTITSFPQYFQFKPQKCLCLLFSVRKKILERNYLIFS